MAFGQHDVIEERNGLTQVWLDEIVSLKAALAEVKAKVFGDGGGAGGYNCSPYPTHNLTDAVAVLESLKLASPPFASFVTPHVLL